jgi:hypothetical protein
MSESTTSSVECPVCSEEFDPTAAGGWCTNSECGQWRYEGVDVGTVEDSTAETPAQSDDPADEDRETEGEVSSPDSSVSPNETGDATPGETEVGGTDEPDAAASGRSDDGDGERANIDIKPAIRRVETGDDGEDATGTAPEDRGEGPAETFDCPGCGAELDADASFCPSCGEDVSDYDPTDEDETEEGLTECPSCGGEVEPEDSFCAGCGENLDAHRGDDGLGACPSCGTDVEAADSFCPGCGEDLDAVRDAGGGSKAKGTDATAQAGSPESLVLATRGEELVVDDGDAVGRELRRLITESGGDQDDAVRIHREHVRFVRENGQFYLEDMGQNPTRLNNVDMEQGDRKPVGPGDEIELSGVITIEVREP